MVIGKDKARDTTTTTTTTRSSSAMNTTVARTVGSNRSMVDSSKTSRYFLANVCVVIVVNGHLLLHPETYDMKRCGMSIYFH